MDVLSGVGAAFSVIEARRGGVVFTSSALRDRADTAGLVPLRNQKSVEQKKSEFDWPVAAEGESSIGVSQRKAKPKRDGAVRFSSRHCGRCSCQIKWPPVP